MEAEGDGDQIDVSGPPGMSPLPGEQSSPQTEAIPSGTIQAQIAPEGRNGIVEGWGCPRES